MVPEALVDTNSVVEAQCYTVVEVRAVCKPAELTGVAPATKFLCRNFADFFTVAFSFPLHPDSQYTYYVFRTGREHLRHDRGGEIRYMMGSWTLLPLDPAVSQRWLY